MSHLDPELAPVDELAERWSKVRDETRSRHPLETIRLMHDGAVLGGHNPPMADDVLAFDQAYTKSPPRYKSLIAVWYKGHGPSAQKAKRLGISRTRLYTEWKYALHYIRGQLRSQGVTI